MRSQRRAPFDAASDLDWPFALVGRGQSLHSWLRTIVGHWLLPISKTVNGLGGSDGLFAEAEPIAVPANNRVTAHVTDFIFMDSRREGDWGTQQWVVKL